MTTTLKKTKPKNCSPSMTTINDLHDEIFVEIITKLSIKDIFRSMAVSKSWCRLISTLCIPTLTESPPHALIYPRNDPWSDPWNQRDPFAIAWLKPSDQIRPWLLSELCPFLPSAPSSCEFLDCRNGFLVFFDRSSMQYYVCNPATQQYVPVPSCFHRHYSETAALVFDPHCRLVVITKSSVLEIKIFSLQTRQWEVSGLRLVNPISPHSCITRLVFANESLYAVSTDGCLLKFDIKQPSVREIELPEIDGTIGCIGMSQGRLHCALEDDDETTMKVWVLHDEWVLKYTLDYPYFAQHPLCSNLPLDNRSSFSVSAFHPTSDVLFIENKTEIYRYDPCTMKLENVCIVSCGGCTISWSLGKQFVFPYSVNLTALEVVNH